MIETGHFNRGFLVKSNALRVGQNDPIGLGKPARMSDSALNRLRFQNHPAAPAAWWGVSGPVPVGSVVV